MENVKKLSFLIICAMIYFFIWIYILGKWNTLCVLYIGLFVFIFYMSKCYKCIQHKESEYVSNHKKKLFQLYNSPNRYTEIYEYLYSMQNGKNFENHIFLRVLVAEYKSEKEYLTVLGIVMTIIVFGLDNLTAISSALTQMVEGIFRKSMLERATNNHIEIDGVIYLAILVIYIVYMLYLNRELLVYGYSCNILDDIHRDMEHGLETYRRMVWNGIGDSEIQ